MNVMFMHEHAVKRFTHEHAVMRIHFKMPAQITAFSLSTTLF